MDSFESRLNEMLQEITQLRKAFKDDESCHSPLERFAYAVLELTELDQYNIVQNNDDYTHEAEPVRASPSVEEWEDFGNFYHQLRTKDTERVGVAIIDLPGHPAMGLPSGTHDANYYGRRFQIQTHEVDGNYLHITLLKDGAFLRKNEPFYFLSTTIDSAQVMHPVDTTLLVENFETWDYSEPWEAPIYAADKDVALVDHRSKYNLRKESCIYPLSDNKLDNTIDAIAGIHTPLMYTSEEFGTPFALHLEDMELASLNVLLWGAPKVWTVIAPHHREKLERIIRVDLKVGAGSQVCDQWVRHQSIYIPVDVLKYYKIHYCQFQQVVGQVVITFPSAYHQGFNAGKNVAEAINFGDRGWDVDNVEPCMKRRCGISGVSKSAFMPRGDMEQLPAVFITPEEAEKFIKPSGSSSKRAKTKASQPRPRVEVSVESRSNSHRKKPSVDAAVAGQSQLANSGKTSGNVALIAAQTAMASAEAARLSGQATKASGGSAMISGQAAVSEGVSGQAAAVSGQTARKTPVPDVQQAAVAEIDTDTQVPQVAESADVSAQAARVSGNAAEGSRNAAEGSRQLRKKASASNVRQAAGRIIDQEVPTPADREPTERWVRWEEDQSEISANFRLKPTVIYTNLASLTVGKEDKSRQLTEFEIDMVLTLVVAFGSPAAFSQLLDVYRLLRKGVNPSGIEPGTTDDGESHLEKQHSPAITTLANVVKHIRILDSIATLNVWNSMRSRICLARFSEGVDTEIASRRAIQKGAPEHPVDAETGSIQRKGNMATSVYKDIMQAAYPDLPPPKYGDDSSGDAIEYKTKYMSIRNSCRHGLQWSLIARSCGWASLALYPTGSIYGLANTEIRDMKRDVFDVLLKTLNLEKGEWLHQVGDNLGFIQRAAVDGIVGLQIPQLRLEKVNHGEIMGYGDQSSELGRLAMLA